MYRLIFNSFRDFKIDARFVYRIVASLAGGS